MTWNIDNAVDNFKEGISNTANDIHEKTNEFHENYVSKVVPDFGKYGDVAKFTAEMIPGVSEYNAIVEGDWIAFAIAAGTDIAAVAAGAFTCGAGYGAVKYGAKAAKAGLKLATKEVAEAGAKKIVKETFETGVEKVAKETVETSVEKVAKETVEIGTEKVLKETVETGVEKVSHDALKNGVENQSKNLIKDGVDATLREGTEKAIKEGVEKLDKELFSDYIDDIQSITKRDIPTKQKELIDGAVDGNNYKKLSPDELKIERDAFNNSKAEIINKWEIETGQKWPRYTEDVLNESGDVIRTAGQPYDAHHVIELNHGGPNEWWNIHPASSAEHRMIHGKEGLARKIFGH